MGYPSSQPFGGVVMVPIFVMLGRFVCAVVDAWRSDQSLRILLAVVVSLYMWAPSW